MLPIPISGVRLCVWESREKTWETTDKEKESSISFVNDIKMFKGSWTDGFNFHSSSYLKPMENSDEKGMYIYGSAVCI